MRKILVTGSVGQIGSELLIALRKDYGNENVIGVWNRTKPSEELSNGPMVNIDVRDKDALEKVILEKDVGQIYHLVSILSATGEKKPNLAWELNVGSLKNVLDLAVKHNLERVFWPSSIAVFGPTTPKENTPQRTVLEPTTIYGVTKLVGEGLCNYYFHKYGLDVRSLRYPGLISWKTPPGGGTTDYAVAIFYEGLRKGEYAFFVSEETRLPMMYMNDAINGTINLMKAKKEDITIRTSYNHSAISFSAKELELEVKKHLPDIKISYIPDERQKIADSWPSSIDDSTARKDWNWCHEYDLKKMTTEMISNIKDKFDMK